MGGIEYILCGDNEPAKQLLWQRIEEKNRLFKHEHPLLNPMLLTQIFKYASPTYTDLKNWRLVCKLWNDLTLPKWRETATLKLTKETEQLVRLPCLTNGIQISTFLQLLNEDDDHFQLKEQPFQRYKLWNVKIDLGEIENPSSKKFWEELGSKMKYLHLEQSTLVQSASVEVPVETLVLEKARNLEELVLTQVKIKKSDWTDEQRPKSMVTLIRERPQVTSQLKSLTVDGKICPFAIPEVVRCSGNLETMSFKNVTNLDENLWKSLYAFRRLSAFQSFNLTEIDLIGVPNGLTVMDGVHRARLPVKVFRCQIAPGQELEMVRISAGFGRTLETLEIFGASSGQLHNIFVGELPLLKELRLWGNVVKNLDFLRFMPKLKILWMNLLCAERWNRDDGDERILNGLGGGNIVGETGGNEIFAGVEKFRIDCELGEEDLRKIGKIMPGLKNLEIILNFQGFGIVGKLWPGLEELGCLLGSRLDDEVVTGMWLPVRWRREGDDRGLGIKKFRNLKSFRLDDFCGKAQLTDECLTNGFLDMFRLENLHICVSAEMSYKAEELLKQAIPHVKVIRNYDNVPGRMTEEDLVNHRMDCLACKTEELRDNQWIKMVAAQEQDILEGDGGSGEDVRSSTPSTVVMMQENDDSDD